MRFLKHSGTPQLYYNSPTGSGRYRKGTGENPYQHEDSLYSSIRKLEKEGYSETEIAQMMNMTVRQYRDTKSYSGRNYKAEQNAIILDMAAQGYSYTAIAEKVGLTEGAVRARLKKQEQEDAKVARDVKAELIRCFEESDYIDVGPGTAQLFGISQTKLSSIIREMVDEDGYCLVTNTKVPQAASPGNYTTLSVLVNHESNKNDVFKHRGEIVPVINKMSEDGTFTFMGIKYPTSVDSSRIMARYDEDGGTAKDGVVEIRRGVDELSLGGANYAQVRIAVDGTHYIKGMAIYGDDKDFPPGVDIIFNTNKSRGTPLLDSNPDAKQVLKPLKIDKQTGEIDKGNPFGSTIRMEDGVVVGQRNYIGEDGKEHLSPVNIVRQEGDWNKWSKTLSSQFLSKQPKELIKKQLDLTYKDMEDQYKEIASIPNNEVRAKLLEDFAEECDTSASHLKAIGLPRQASKVILPLTTIADDEVYAPTFKQGEEVALVRYPHAGTFEIPVLKVNNNIPEGDRVIRKSSIDAIGISPKVAERLSGADFDGDTVTVLPTYGQKIKSTPALRGLENFNPKKEYPEVEGMKYLSKGNKQNEMGKVSNLITDMTLKGATPEEVTRAVKHSMVVIDAEKHKLNYKLSEEVNGIAELKQRYQGGSTKGASTLISKSNADKVVPKRNNYIVDPETNKRKYIDPETGEKLWSNSGETYQKPVKNKKTGEVTYRTVVRTQKVSRMSDVKDARELSSGTWQEELYASHANKLKALANKCRLESYNTESSKTNKAAKELYANEVKSLNNKLTEALINKPYERQAQNYASVVWSAKVKANPEIRDDKDEAKKIKNQALAAGRLRTGAKKQQIQITEDEWKAIEAGAISHSRLKEILNNSDMDYVKKLAMPKTSYEISDATKMRINNYAERGYTLSDISESLGISVSTVSKYLEREE